MISVISTFIFTDNRMTTIYVDGIRRDDVLNDRVISERAGG